MRAAKSPTPLRRPLRRSYLSSDVARASSPASKAGVPPPSNISRGGTRLQSAGEDARATPGITNCPPKSASILVLGLGNDIMTDDAIGLRIARSLHEHLGGNKDIVIVESAEMGLALLDLVAGFDQLVVVDAIQTGRVSPGFLHEIKPSELPLGTNRSPHFVGLAEILALGRELALAVPKEVKIFAVEVQDAYTVGTQMTPALEAALPAAVERVLRLLV